MHTYFVEVQCVILARPRLHAISMAFPVDAGLDHVPERTLVRFLLHPLITEYKTTLICKGDYGEYVSC